MRSEQGAGQALKILDSSAVGTHPENSVLYGSAATPAVLCVVGLPGQLSVWCGTLLASLAGHEHQEGRIFTANSLADLGRRLLNSAPLPSIALVHYPETSLCDALAAERCRFLLVTTPPEAAVDILVAQHGMSAPDAVRAAANAHTAAARLAAAPGAMVIGADGADAMNLAAAIAAHLGVPMHRPDVPPLPALAHDRASTTAGETDFRALIDAALADGADVSLPASTLAAAALPPVTGSHAGPVTWPRDLLMTGASLPATGAIDMTGPSRCVLYGPYIRLPAGSWSCALLFGCTPEAVGLAMVADVFAGTVLNQVSFTIEEAGVFEIEIPFENVNPDLPIEIRLFSARATFEGRIAVGRATLTQLVAKRLKVR